MAYNKDFPADDSYLADFPSGEREQIRAIVEDKIVNAGKLQGLAPSNASGQVPVSNGTVCNNLNADKLDGYDASHFSDDGHLHNNASTSTAGFMSAADKTKLDGVATGAEVNQNAFGNVAVGTSTLQADNKQDTLYIAAGSNVSIAADETNDKITIGLTGIVPVANGGTGASSLANITVGNATADASGNNIANTYATKADISNEVTTKNLNSANLTVTGSTSVPTANADNNSKTIANKAYVDAAINSAVAAAVTSVTKTLSDNMHAQYPVGSYIYSDKANNPATYLPYMSDTTWVQTAAGRVLIGAGTADSGTVYKAGDKGGEETTGLEIKNLPPHSFSGTTSLDGDHNHNMSLPQRHGGDGQNTNGTAYFSNGDTSRSSGGNGVGWTSQAGRHQHTFTTNTLGAGVKHNNMPPYQSVYRWVRIA